MRPSNLWPWARDFPLAAHDSVLDDSRETVYVPTLRLDFMRSRAWFECELGAEFGDRTLTSDQETHKRYYFGLGYRLNF